ncbi:MAG: CmcJ/NvfI family oxidoreductase [Pseudomonadota bacterium]
MVSVEQRTGEPAIRASLQYLASAEAKPVLHASVGGGDTTRHEAIYQDHTVDLINARDLADPPRLDREGFALVRHQSQVEDFFDKQQVSDIYETEVQQIIKEATGAVQVLVFDHTLRADAQDTQVEKGIREPAWFVHNDYTRRSAPQRLRDHLPAADAESLLSRRFAIVNCWRPVVGPVQATPLAICDARSVAPNDLVKSERRSKDRVGEILLAHYNPAHRWHYFPDMETDEVLLIKTFDSATSSHEPATIHGAFVDPTTPAGALPRQSIESRSFAFF